MPSSRRDFIRNASLAGAGLALAPSVVPALPTSANEPSPAAPRPRRVAPKKLLILGGTGFIGPHTVRYALERGHQVTILTRGKSATKVEGVEHIIADREGDMGMLSARKWDAVLDNNARDYRWVARSTAALKNSTPHYLFVSSISAYKTDNMSYATAGMVRTTPLDESAERFAPAASFKDGDEAPYGLTKAISENLVHAAFPNGTTIVRPGLIVGPGDPTDRFTYWPARFARGGECLAPGNPDNDLQFIDVRDLGAWIVHLIEQGTMGPLNAVGFDGPLSVAEFLHTGKGTVNHKCSFTWVDDAFLEKEGVSAWGEMGCWTPQAKNGHCSNARAIAAGATYRPIADTIRDTVAWVKEGRGDRKWAAGMTAERERELLAKWKAR